MTGKPENSKSDTNRQTNRATSSNKVPWRWQPNDLAQLSQALLTAASWEDVLKISLEAIPPTDVSGITFLLANGSPDDQHLEVVAAWNQNSHPKLAPGTQFDRQETLFQSLWTTGESMVINEASTDTRISEHLRSTLLQAEIKAFVALPLIAGHNPFGAVLIDRATPEPFNTDIVRGYEAWFALAQGTLEKLWLIRENEQALTRTSALYEISQRLLESETVNDILQTVLDSGLFGAKGGTIALLEPSLSDTNIEDQELVFWATAGAGAERLVGLRMPVSEGVVGWVVRENKPAAVPDAYADRRFYPKVDQEIDFRTQSILCVPLSVEDRVIGALELVDVRHEYLNQEGARLLSQVANQAARLIQNQRLLKETQRQAQELSLLLDVSQDLSSSLEREETLQLITSRILDLVRADGCDVFLLENTPDGDDVLMPVASSDRYAQQILSTPLKIGQGITGRVAESGVGIIANRVDLDPRGFQIPGTPEEPESLISVPLISEGRRIGVMTVSRLGEEEFGRSDLNIVTAMAGQAAAVLEKARLFREVQQRSQELAALNAVVSTASQSLTQEEILNATLKRVTEVMPGSSGLICLHDPATGDLQLAMQRNLPGSLLERLHHNGMHWTLCTATSEFGQAFHIPDLASAPSFSDQLQDEEISNLIALGLRTYLGTPLTARGQVLGTLSVFSSEPNTFSPSDAELLTAIGQQVGIAVRHAQLYEQTERDLAMSTSLYEASQAISNTLETEDVLQITINRMTQFIDADQGRLVLFDDELGYGHVVAESFPTPGIEDAHIPMQGNSLYEELRAGGQTICVEDVHTDPIISQESGILIDADAESMLLVPLIVQARLIGAVSLTSRECRTFSESEMGFCRTLADRAALALENRQLFSQTYFTLQETTLLYQASRALTQARDLNDVIDAITNSLPIKEIDQCWIALLDSDLADDDVLAERSVEIKALWDHEGDTSLLDQRFTAQQLPVIAQPDTTTKWIVNDVGSTSVLDTQSLNTFRALGIKSALIVPLTTGERLLGWLLLITHHHTHIFNPEQIRPYQALADQAAVAIRNQQLLQQVQDSLQEVETVHRQYLRREWANYIQSAEDRLTAFAYDHGTLVPAQDLTHPLVDRAVRQGAPVVFPSGEEIDEEFGYPDEQEMVTDQTTDNTEGQRGSGIVTPLMVRGQVIGALGLEDPDQPHDWTEDELTLVQEIADRVAQAIENARLLDETQVSLAETERLYNATGRLSEADSAQVILQILAEEVNDALGPAFSGSILCSGPNPVDRIDWLEVGAQWNPAEVEIPGGTRFSIYEHPMLNHFLRQRAPIHVDKAEMSTKYRLTWEIFAQPSTLIAIPLVVGNSWLGVINIVGQEERTPDLRTMRFLQNLADRAAVALESARLYDETQRRALQMEAASRVSRAASSILEQDILLPTVVDLIRDHFGYYHAQVFLLDPAEEWAVLAASTGEIGKKLLQRGHALKVGGDSLIGRVTATGEPRNAQDVTEDSVHYENPDLPNTRAELAVPIKIGMRVIGALDVQSTETAAFGPDDTAVLSTLADQLATAIENARLYQEQLKTAEQLREVDRLKSQFMANMSHELRTPLNSIIGFSRVILKGIDGPITELQRQDLTAIYNSGQLLLKLINDVLDISKIAAGKMELAFEEIELSEIMQSVVTTTAALVKDKPAIELRHNIAPGLPPIIADSTRLRQVLLNLLSNAVKFTEEGYIELSATYDARYVIIQVSDTGIGIPAEKFDVIFQEFEQVDGSATRAIGGTGLGLAISRHFIEMHNGRISVESEVDAGSTFTIQLPIKGPAAEELEEQEDLAQASERRLILAIDDEEDVIKLYKRYLEKQNYEVIGLSDSERAMQTTREVHPHAILLDLLMPKKDGWTVIQELKTDPGTQDIPIIMCSIVSAAGRGFSMGAADFLVKPISEERLLTALARLEDRKERGPDDIRRVLIIDDTLEDRKFLRRVLESASEPYQVVEASGGLEGVESIQQERPDIIVLDLIMPEMDGFAVLETLKRDKETRRIPIIIVSAKELTEQERNQINGQVAALFQKGLFQEEELLQDLHHALRRVQKPRQEERTEE